MERGIPIKVLSDAITSKIGGRRVKSAVFTTYTFQPDFFEPEILPLLFDRAFSPHQRVRMLELEDALRTIHNIAVYYDRGGLDSELSAELDYRRIPLARKTGVFHPKLVLLLLEEADDLETNETPAEALLVGVTSANLTKAGWWANVECCWFEEYSEGARCSIRSDLFALFSDLKKDDRTGATHEALNAIHEFLKDRTTAEDRRSANGVLHPRLFVGTETLSDFLEANLAGRVDSDSYNLEVISPYFDQHDEFLSLKRLVEALHPKETRVYLPFADDGTALVRKGLFDTLKGIPRVRWGKIQGSLLSKGKSDDGTRQSRSVHAKVYRIFSRSECREFVVAGSVNLTQAAHSRSNSGNLEASVLLDRGAQKNLQFWLDVVGDNEYPEEFKGQDETLGIEVPPLSLRFDWFSKRAEYFWDSAIKSAIPTVLKISSAGEHLFDIDTVVKDEWVYLEGERSEQIRRILESTSIVSVSVDGHPGASILIQEERMEHKPSVIEKFSLEEILRYWSLLSAEQKQAFLESKLSKELGSEGIAINASRLDIRDSMFSRFAGIFHAFAKLEERVVCALTDGRPREAEAYLFGAGYLSLPTVITRVEEDVAGDDVNRYVTLLSAMQLLDRLEGLPDCREFAQASSEMLNRQKERIIELTNTLKTRFSFGDSGETVNFLKWFENAFQEEIPPMEVA